MNKIKIKNCVFEFDVKKKMESKKLILFIQALTLLSGLIKRSIGFM